MPETISAADLLPLDLFAADSPFALDLVYAQLRHPQNQFLGLYHPNARLFAHRLLVPILLRAARLAQVRGVTLQILDCFRPVEAQAAMARRGFLPELVAPPGIGGHPRGLAVDVRLLAFDKTLLDMGTPFDFFTDDLADNPAARDYADLTPVQRQNRQMLDEIMDEASAGALIGLLQEWWDYRFPAPVHDRYAPCREADLPAVLRMTTAPDAPDPALQATWQQARAEILAGL